MNSNRWLIIAVVIYGLMNRYEGHVQNNNIWVVDHVIGSVKVCSVSECIEVK